MTVSVAATQITDLKVNVPGGYKLLSGWTVRCVATGRLFTVDGVHPWLPKGGKGAALEVEASGLLPSAKFLDAR